MNLIRIALATGPHGPRRLFSPLLYQLSYLAAGGNFTSENGLHKRRAPEHEDTPASGARMGAAEGPMMQV